MSTRAYRAPRITARAQFDADDISTYTREATTPDVTITVKFDHGDHARALTLLEQAISEVRDQIAEVAP